MPCITSAIALKVAMAFDERISDAGARTHGASPPGFPDFGARARAGLT